jgi:hypothetical protein
MEELSLLLQAFESAGIKNGIVYLSVPITSGGREIRLMKELGCKTRSELQAQYPERYASEVIRKNEQAAAALATKIRAAFAHDLVINPGPINVFGWTQEDYGKLWEQIVSSYAIRVVVAPEWELSRGARAEVGVALQRAIPIMNAELKALGWADIKDLDRNAHDALRSTGWSEADVEAYLPPLSISSVPPPSSTQQDFAAQMRAAAEVFSWLRGERDYQVAKFGIDLDDEHTTEGLGEDGWWWQQLMNYFHRSRVLGLETPVGRQALAKFVATACGLLESTVRVYGPLPLPGGPSGENIESTRPN